MWNSHKPIFLLALGTFAIMVGLLFSVTLMLGSMGFWVWDWGRIGALSLTVLVLATATLFIGYFYYPYGIITVVSKGGKSGNKEIEILCEGRRICKNTALPVQIRMYFQRAGEYRIYLLQGKTPVIPPSNGEGKSENWAINFHGNKVPSVELSV